MTTFVHLVPDDEDPHVLGVGCWCEPEQTDGEWGDRPAVLVDHRQETNRDGPHSVFLQEGNDEPFGETLPDDDDGPAAPPALRVLPGGRA